MPWENPHPESAAPHPPKKPAAKPPVAVDLFVDCGSYGRVARFRPNGRWIDPYTGEEVRNVISWLVL